MKKNWRLPAVLLACLCLLSLPALAGEADVWDGAAVKPATLVEKDGVYYYEIRTCEELAYIAQEGGDWLTYNYLLANDLILNETAPAWDEEGNCLNADELLAWTPIGKDVDELFTGTLDGGGYTISGLYVALNSYSYDTGFIACTNDGAVIRDLTIKNAYVKGSSTTGGLVGYMFGGSITGCSFDGLVMNSGDHHYAGGLVGEASGSDIRKCSASGHVIASGYAGGLVGYNWGMITDCYSDCTVTSAGGYAGGLAGMANWTGFIGNSHAAGDVFGVSGAGGLVGYNNNSNLEISWASGDVNASNGPAGGLAGSVNGTWISACFAAGNVTSENGPAGGLVGEAVVDHEYDGCVVENCYSLGDVSATTYAGGLIGAFSTAYDNSEFYPKAISNCYSAGAVLSGENRGGFLGEDRRIWGESFTIRGCYFLRDTGVNDALAATSVAAADVPYEIEGKTLAQLQTQTTFAGWDFATVWAVDPNENGGLPYLWLQDGEPDPNPLPAYRIDSVTLRDTEGTALSHVPEGDFLATLSVTKLTEDSDALALLACYTHAGQYLGLMWVGIEGAPVGSAVHVTLPVDNAGGEIARITAFTVASFDDLTPLGEAVTVE